MNRIIIDIDLLRAVTSLTDNSLLADTLSMKCGNPEELELQFVSQLEGVELDAGVSITAGLKIKTALSGSYDASVTGFTKTGTGNTAIYSATLSLDTVELRAEFDAKPGTATLNMYLEIAWTISGLTKRTQLIPILVENQLNRGGEAAVTANSQLQVLTDAATVNWSATNAINVAKVTLGGNRTLAITAKPGTVGSLIVVQDGTGSRTLTLPTGSKTNGGGGVSLTSAAGAIDLLNYVYDGTSFYWTHFNNFS